MPQKLLTNIGEMGERLSLGQRQRLGIARALYTDAEILIFDEPTSGLDVITAESIIQLIRDCKSQNKTVIFSSHIMGEVDLLCDRLMIIHKGEVKYKGEMKDFREHMTEKNLTGEFIKTVQS